MMVERHYDDEALISLLESGRVAHDVHIPSCPLCREKLESFHDLSGILHDSSVWDHTPLADEPVPITIAALRGYADRMTEEDARADDYLRELLAGPRTEWFARLQQHPELRTAGVVRKLVAASDRAVDTMPPDALEISRLATDIADHLDPADQPSDTVARLRGAAWRDRAYVLFYTGDFVGAEKAADRAERHFRTCLVDEYEIARVGIVRALVDRALEHGETAARTANESAVSLAAFGDTRRYVGALLAQAHLLYSRSDFVRAGEVLDRAERALRNSDDAETQARVLSNIAFNSWKLGRIEKALRDYDLSIQLFTEMGTRTEALRLEWNVAALLAGAGRTAEAEQRYRRVAAEFSQLGMASEATLAKLDIAELMLVQSRYDEVESICRAAMQAFEAAGLTYTARALTALAYMREAAQRRKVTPSLVHHVREYIRSLPKQETLLFLPPPS